MISITKPGKDRVSTVDVNSKMVNCYGVKCNRCPVYSDCFKDGYLDTPIKSISGLYFNFEACDNSFTQIETEG